MIPPRSTRTASAPGHDDSLAPGPDAGLAGADGVIGDVLLTVLLAAAVAALVGALLFLLWRALPAATATALFAVAPPPFGVELNLFGSEIGSRVGRPAPRS